MAWGGGIRQVKGLGKHQNVLTRGSVPFVPCCPCSPSSDANPTANAASPGRGNEGLTPETQQGVLQEAPHQGKAKEGACVRF